MTGWLAWRVIGTAATPLVFVDNYELVTHLFELDLIPELLADMDRLDDVIAHVNATSSVRIEVTTV